MLSPETYSAHIRLLILTILYEAAKAGKVESGGWFVEARLRKHLSSQGYDLSLYELRAHLIYLQDSEIACTQTQKTGDDVPYTYKYRITAKGVRVCEGSTHVPGIGFDDGVRAT